MKFNQTHPDDLSFQDLTYLNAAAQRGNTLLREALSNARNNQGTFYTCEKGAMYIERFAESLNVVLLGGDDLMAWRDDLTAFMKSLLEAEGVAYLCVLGRYGWHRVLKDLTPLGTIFIGQTPPKNN